MRKVLETVTDNRDRQVDKILEVVVKHHDGYYKVHCNLLEDAHDGFITWKPFQEGDFNIKIAEGRKSAKKLDKYNSYINNNADELFNLWSNKEYTQLAVKVRDAV